MSRQQINGVLALVLVMGIVVTLAPQQAAAAPVRLPQIIDLFSPTCPHCQRMMPVIDKLRTQLQGKIEVIAVDIRKDAKTADKYQVSAIPTLVFLDTAGKEVFRHVGEYPEEDILAKLRELGWR